MTFSSPLTVSWNNQTRLSVGSSGACSLCGTCFPSDRRVPSVLFWSLYAQSSWQHWDNATFLSVITEPWGQLLSWPLLLLQPLWIHCGWSQSVLCLIRSYWILALAYGQKWSITLRWNIPQQTTFWDLFSDASFIILGSRGETRKPFPPSQSFFKPSTRGGKMIESWYCQPHFTDEMLENWNSKEEWQLMKLLESQHSRLGHDQGQILVQILALSVTRCVIFDKLLNSLPQFSSL